MTDNSILSIAEIRNAELNTIKNTHIASIDLMEKAGAVFTETLLKNYSFKKENVFAVFCGSGNNGGDGLVIGRLLGNYGFNVKIFLFISSHNSNENLINKERIISDNCKNIELIEINDNTNNDLCDKYFVDFNSNYVIIDAIFGIGMSKKISGIFEIVINNINKTPVSVISVDVPSGLFCDQHTPAGYPCIKATQTYTFQYLKTAFLLPENYDKVGNCKVLDIGIFRPNNSKINNRLITVDTVKFLLNPVPKFAHKGSNGHGLLIAGCSNMPGAAMLASKSALRTGAGKITLHTASKVADIVAVANPEIVLDRDENDHCISKVNVNASYNAIAIGPGISNTSKATSVLRDLLNEVHSPLILDADALNILANNKSWMAYLPPLSILTPHFKEFERIAGTSENDFDRIEKAKALAKKYNIILVLKGAYSFIAYPDGRAFFNSSGNQGMATAGSGDVLTGILLALLSKGYKPEIATIIGVYLHGLAADIAIENYQSYESLIASDIIDFIGEAYKRIYSQQ